MIDEMIDHLTSILIVLSISKIRCHNSYKGITIIQDIVIKKQG